MNCELCTRDVPLLTVHHLIPKDEHGKHGPTITVCPGCHHQIHSLFDNKILAKELNTLEKLQNQPEMKKFLAWVRKQSPDKRIKTHRKNI
jgi:HNH endonuclease